jgi:hypothetical protein
MGFEEWVIKYCWDGDNLEINRYKDYIYVFNKRANSVFAISKNKLREDKTQKESSKAYDFNKVMEEIFKNFF